MPLVSVAAFADEKTLHTRVYLQVLPLMPLSRRTLVMACFQQRAKSATLALMLLVCVSAFTPNISFAKSSRPTIQWSLSSKSSTAWTEARGSRGRAERVGGTGVSSLRCEVLPEGGVSPCVIKVGAHVTIAQPLVHWDTSIVFYELFKQLNILFS